MNREPTQDQVLRDVFRLLRRQAVVIVAAVLVAVAAAVAYSVLKTPVYEASAELQFVLQVEYLPEAGIPAPFTGIDPAERAAQDAERITSRPVVRGVAEAVDTDLSTAEIEESVTTAVNPDSNLVTLRVRADSAELAADLANAFADETMRIVTQAERTRLLDTAEELEQSVRGEDEDSVTRMNTLQSASQLRSLAQVARPVEVVDTAEEPDGPVSPQPVRDTVLALFLGLIFGTLLAFLRDSLDRRLTDAHEIQHQLQIPMLGYVEEHSLGGIGFARNGAEESIAEHGLEPFRILRSNVEFLAQDKPLRTIAVTSPVAEEGKSTVAAGLATAAAMAGKQVLLVECDLRRPVFANRFNIDASPGLVDWTVGNARPADVIQQVPIEDRYNEREGSSTEGQAQDVVQARSLILISAGSFSSRPAEILASERFKQFLGQVSKLYDLVVLDCTPLLPVGDTLEVLPEADATLLCIRLDQTTREQALAARAALEHLPSRPVGLVVTGVRPGREGYYYGYYSSVPSPPAVVISAGPGQSSGLSQQ